MVVKSVGEEERHALGVVPRVVVNQSCSIREPSNLVTVIPPAHNLCVLLGVLSQPIIRFSKVVNDVLTSIRVSRSQHDRRGRVSRRGDPSAVKDEEEE